MDFNECYVCLTKLDEEVIKQELKPKEKVHEWTNTYILIHYFNSIFFFFFDIFSWILKNVKNPIQIL